jgi:hypothetical protein
MTMTARIKPRPEVYTRVTAKVIADFEQGVRSWQKPWNSKYTAGRITRGLAEVSRTTGMLHHKIHTGIVQRTSDKGGTMHDKASPIARRAILISCECMIQKWMFAA